MSRPPMRAGSVAVVVRLTAQYVGFLDGRGIELNSRRFVQRLSNLSELVSGQLASGWSRRRRQSSLFGIQRECPLTKNNVQLLQCFPGRYHGTNRLRWSPGSRL